MAFMPHSALPCHSAAMRQILIPLLIAVLATIAAVLIAVPPRAHARADKGDHAQLECGRAPGCEAIRAGLRCDR
jgi:hypothetical protein